MCGKFGSPPPGIDRSQDSLLDKELALQAGSSLEPLPLPFIAMALDRRIIAWVTHFWQSFRTDFIPAFKTQMVLGYPWECHHTPHIDWVQGKVESCSFSLVCLRSALTLRGGLVTPCGPPVPPDSRCPKNTMIFEVFSTDKVFSLPPHRPYDCAIDLLTGAFLPPI